MDFKLFPGAQSRADDYELITDRVCVVGFIRRRKKGSGAPMRALLKRLGGPPERIPEGSRRLGDGLRRSRGVWGALGVSRGLWGGVLEAFGGVREGSRGTPGALRGLLGESWGRL